MEPASPIALETDEQGLHGLISGTYRNTEFLLDQRPIRIRHGVSPVNNHLRMVNPDFALVGLAKERPQIGPITPDDVWTKFVDYRNGLGKRKIAGRKIPPCQVHPGRSPRVAFIEMPDLRCDGGRAHDMHLAVTEHTSGKWRQG